MKLIIEDDDGRKTVVPFAQDEISIGREAGNTVRLTERNVSRRHALIARQDNVITIEDLDSFNGVRVNGDRIQGRSKLKLGDLIQIGDYDLALDDESKASLAERPTQPELTPVPDRVAPKPRGEDLPFHNDNEAVARFQKAAAIQALFAKRETAPPAAALKEAWPDKFHFVAPGAVEQLKKTDVRRKRIILGAVIGSAAIFVTILAFGLRRPSVAAPAGIADPRDAIVEPDAVAPAAVAPVPSVAPTPVPAPHDQIAAPPVAPAPAPAPRDQIAAPQVAPAPVPAPHDQTVPPTHEKSSVAPASPPEPRAKSVHASPNEASRRKALNLYQDAFADVGNGDYSDALEKLRTSIELDPTSAAAQKEIAICYSHLRQPDKGVAHYEQYLKLRPDAPDAADVRKMLSDYHASKGTELVP